MPRRAAIETFFAIWKRMLFSIPQTPNTTPLAVLMRLLAELASPSRREVVRSQIDSDQ
jgi:hypothetical protein